MPPLPKVSGPLSLSTLTRKGNVDGRSSGCSSQVTKLTPSAMEQKRPIRTDGLGAEVMMRRGP